MCLHRGLDKDMKCLNGKDEDGEHRNTVNEVDREHSNTIPVAGPIDTGTGDVT